MQAHAHRISLPVGPDGVFLGDGVVMVKVTVSIPLMKQVALVSLRLVIILVQGYYDNPYSMEKKKD